MTVEVEPGHENDAVDAEFPLLSKHHFRLSPKVTGTNIFVASFLGFEELLTFREADSESTNTDGDSSSCPENDLWNTISVKYNVKSVQSLTFQDSVSPPTPKFAQAARTYPKE